MDADERSTDHLCGVVNEDDVEFKILSELWDKFKKFITEEDLNTSIKAYKGSDTERGHIKAAYLSGKGCTSHIMNEVLFMTVDDEPRVQIIVKEMIEANEVPEHEMFASKHNDLENNYEEKAKEAEQIQEEFAPQDREQQHFEKFAEMICKSKKFKQMIRKNKEKEPGYSE